MVVLGVGGRRVRGREEPPRSRQAFGARVVSFHFLLDNVPHAIPGHSGAWDKLLHGVLMLVRKSGELAGKR